MAEETNYYMLLGLFDPNDDLVGTGDNDPAVMAKIDQAIADRSREWSSDSRNPRKASVANHNLDLVKYAKQNLSTMDMRRAAHAQAFADLQKDVSKLIKIHALKGYLIDVEIDEIAKQETEKFRCSITADMVKDLVPNGVEVKQGEEGPKGLELTKPKAFSQYSTQESRLSPYGHANLYDMLDPGNSKIKSVPTQTWLSKAKEAKAALPNKADTNVSDHQKLYNLCIGTTFKDDTSRAEYDEYLTYKSLMAVLEEVKEASSITKKLSANEAEQYVDRIFEAASKNGKPITREQASGYLLWYCGKNSILYMPPAQHADQSTLKQPCPWCGSLLDSGAVTCSSCGGKVLEKCPKCSTDNRSDVHFCTKCGYDYTNLRTASALCSEAKSLIGSLRFDDAEQVLQQAEAAWPGLTDIATVKSNLVQQRQLIGPAAEQLASAVKDSRLFEAKKLYEDIERRASGFANLDLKNSIDSGIAKAKMVFEAAGSDDVSKILEAYDACHDYPGIAPALASHSPTPVAAVQVRPDGTAHRAYVSWTPAPLKEASYVLLRKRGGRPLDEHDGEELTRTAATEYVDETVGCGEPYCYAVIVKLGPLSSTMTASDPATLYFDVTNVKVSPNQATIQITWGGVPASGAVQVWRRQDRKPSAPGDGEEVSNVTGSGLLDQHLNNDVEYFYGIFVAYQKPDGDKAYSSGVTCSGIPSAPPEPIDFLLAQLQQDSSFRLEWEAPEGGEARFFYTKGQIPFTEGDEVAESELEAQMMPLQVAATGPDTGTFALPDDAVYRVVSATVKNGNAVIGTSTSVSSKRAVAIKNIVASGADAMVLFDWPEECERVLLVCRTDRFAASADDRGGTRQIVSKMTYDIRKAIVVNGLDPNTTYYFSLFAQIGAGDSASFSAGSTRTFSFGNSGKSVYYVNVKKSFGFGKIKDTELVIESAGDLGATQLRASAEEVPVFPNQGLLVADIPAQHGAGEHRIPLPSGALTKGMHYKLFFKDPAMYQTASLAQKTGIVPEIG